MLLWNKRTFAWLTSSMLLSLERANAEALLFTRLLATFAFFYWNHSISFFNYIARYAQSKESRNLPKKIPQITCKAIFRNCLSDPNANKARSRSLPNESWNGCFLQPCPKNTTIWRICFFFRVVQDCDSVM